MQEVANGSNDGDVRRVNDFKNTIIVFIWKKLKRNFERIISNDHIEMSGPGNDSKSLRLINKEC